MFWMACAELFGYAGGNERERGEDRCRINAPAMHRSVCSEILQPARMQGYRSIWLAGASMGDTGTLLYDAAYPGSLDGLVLFAPYLGDEALLREFCDAGGIARWQPGPPQSVTADTWQRELWRHLQT
jgi:hypothetical protein